MNDLLTQAARLLAASAGAEFSTEPGVAFDTADPGLTAMTPVLAERLAAVGATLLAVIRTETGLAAWVADDQAEEPISPAAFQSVVRRLAWSLLGEVWEGRLVTAQTRRQEALVA